MEYLQYKSSKRIGCRPLRVLNLVKSGLPSIRCKANFIGTWHNRVLNLIISGIPSILPVDERDMNAYSCIEF